MIRLNLDNSRIQTTRTEAFEETGIPFAGYEPDIEGIETLASRYKEKKNIVVIGNGGSITSFHYYATALGTDKNFFVLSSMEPDFLHQTGDRCDPEDTVIIVVSKSGNTVGVVENLMFFINQGHKDIVTITEDKKSAIKNIQEHYGYEFIEHPVIGGRFSGFTPSGLLPAAIAGLDIRAIWKGAKQSYEKYSLSNPGNDAQKLANVFCELDKQGYSEIFMPIYSSKLEGSINILMQLLHESSGKEGKGQTLVATFAPESQHHTNQRFFGGKKNMLGCFVTVDKCEFEDDRIKIPEEIKDIALRNGTLGALDGNTYSHALHTEFMGTFEDTKDNEIPAIEVQLDRITPETVGEYLAFWHYVTVYVCMILGVDPFDQPQVENSKKISFRMRTMGGEE